MEKRNKIINFAELYREINKRHLTHPTMRKYILLLLALCTSLSLMAERIESHIAVKIAKTLMHGNEFIDLSKNTDYDNFYIFTTENSFVIVSADDRAKPILAYSNEFPFITENIPDNISYWLNSLDDEIQYAIDNDIKASKEIESLWDNLKKGIKPQPKNTVIVEPLIKTRWKQTTPFNDMCPTDSSGDRAAAGCVAIAMAQVMRYWEWPHKGEGSHSYHLNSYGTIEADFSTIYDWDNMLVKPDITCTQEEQDAVATLAYHCGVSIEMYYGPNSSSAHTDDIPYALETYFGYSHNMQHAYKEDYSDSEWITLLKTELDAKRPVLYEGMYKEVGGGGHSFVCDGYDENDYFHFNWGWGGSCDGYFAIGALNPSSIVVNCRNYIALGVEPGDAPIDAPSDVTTEVNGHDVTISWTPHADANHYKLYRNGFLIKDNITDNSFTDTYLPYGSYNYQVKSVKADGYYSVFSNTAEAVVSYEEPIPTNLTAMQENEYDVKLSWDCPETNTTVLKYGDAESSDDKYGGNYLKLYWGQKYTAEQLSEYDGMSITAFQAYLAESDTYPLLIYKDVNCTPEQQMSQSFNYDGNGSWATVNLTTPFLIDDSSDIIITLNNNNIDYPAVHTYYSGNGNACLYSINGINFFSINNKSWLFRTILSDTSYSYNIYRDSEEIANNITQNEYLDFVPEYGTYEYTVRTNYHGVVSAPSEPAYITIEPNATEENYDDNIMIYPNPANDNINIVCDNMKSVEILSLMGQVMYCKDVESDYVSIDMPDLNQGIYIIKIIKGDGKGNHVCIRRLEIRE